MTLPARAHNQIVANGKWNSEFVGEVGYGVKCFVCESFYEPVGSFFAQKICNGLKEVLISNIVRNTEYSFSKVLINKILYCQLA
jgi:hypothetical protein